MWSRITGKSDSSSKDDRRRTESSGTRSKRAESIVSSSSSRKPTRGGSEPRPGASSSRNSYPPPAPASVASSYATARDGASEYNVYDSMGERDRLSRAANDDLYDDPRDERSSRRRNDRTSSYETKTPRRERSRSRDRDGKKVDKEKDKREGKKKSRSERSSSMPQAGGYRGEIVEEPKPLNRSFSGQINQPGFSQFPGQAGAPMMSGALPVASASLPMDPHVANQFPGQDPAQYSQPFMPGLSHTDSFGEAAEYYGDQGESVQTQPGVRPQPPSVIMPLDTPHLNSASAEFNPAQDTGSGAAADFYGTGNVTTSPSKPPRPSMPGAFTDEGPPPTKPPRPSSSKPDKPGKSSKPSKPSSAAALAGGAALGYALGHNSTSHNSTSYNSTSYTNGTHGASASFYHAGDNASIAATDGSQIPTYSEAMEGAPPVKPPRPSKPEKHGSGSSHAGLYAAGAAGLAAYGLHHHNSHHNSHHHSSSMPGAFPGDHYGGVGPSPSPFMSGGMAQRHEHKGPVSKFVDWWKDHEDVRKMEEYTEYIGVCRGCFDPRSSVMDAPRKHHYSRKRSSEFRPAGIEKQSRYSLSEKPSRYSLSGDESKRKSSNKTGWLAAGLGTAGLAAAGKALWNQNRDDFDDTYSIKSGRDARSSVSRRSRSRSRDRKRHSSGRSEIRYRSRSRDRMSHVSTGITGDRKDYKIVRHRSRSRSRSRSRDRKSGLMGAALGAGLAASAVGASRRKHRSRSRSRSTSPQKVFVHHRRDSSDHDRRRSKTHRSSGHKSSRSSIASGSFVDISQTHRPQSGILGGFFAAPPEKRRKSRHSNHSHSHSKKKKGFFNFGNASSSSSDSGLAFGAGYVKNRKRASRRSSDEKLNATLVGLGATAAAIAATQAGRSKHGGKHRPEVVAVREHRHKGHGGDRRRSGRSSRYASDEEEGWESLPEDDTSDSGSMSSGLAFGDYDWRKGKSQESLASSASGTSKWGWRWGSKKKKKQPSSESLYNAGANTSFVGPTVAGAAAGAAIGATLGRHDSSASSAPTLQSVYPVQTDATTFDARRTSAVPTPQPLVTAQPNGINIQQPQPIHQVPGAIYSTQAQPQPSYVAPTGPPVFSSTSQYSYPSQMQPGFVESPQQTVAPPLPRRSNSSPIQSSSWKRDAAIAGGAAALGAAAIAATKSKDSQSVSSPSNVRFELTKEQAKKEERERRREQERREEEDRRREKQRREDDARREEEERRRREKQRREEEARKYEAERLARIEAEQHEADRRRERAERRAREAREVEERERRDREARIEAQRKEDLEREAEQMRRERREAERREAEIREDTERRRREREAQEFHDRERESWKLEQQRTGSSVASDVRRKERELQDRERDIVQPETWKDTAAAATVAGAAAVITSAAISSRRDKAPFVKPAEPGVKRVEPSKVAQDYADEEIFDPDIFKKQHKQSSAREVLQDWEDRYNEKPVSQADFFAPTELRDHSSTSPRIDPNEGATDIHVYQAHDDLDLGPPKVPPYPPSYSFTPSKDGYNPTAPWPVPTLNLIQPTPPGSRANSVRGVSLPPSPVIEPKEEPKKDEPKPEEAARRGSRVSWGENQFHNYEVPTPDSYREQFISDRDLKNGEKHSHDEIVVEVDSPESGKRTTSYRPERETKAPEKQEIAPSTQYVPDQDDSNWTDMMSKKTSKKGKKKAKAAAAAATAAAALATFSTDDKVEKSSTTTRDDPFSDAHSATPTTIPSTSSVYQAPFYESVSDIGIKPSRPKGFVEGEITAEPEPMHIPGSFDEEPQTDQPAEEEWADIPKKGKKGKKKSKNVDSEVISPEAQRIIDQTPAQEIESPKESIPEPEPERKLSKKEKRKAKAAKRASSDKWEDPDSSQPDTPQVERDIRDIEPTSTYSMPSSRVADSSYDGGIDLGASKPSASTSKAAAAASAGGFAGLVSAAMRQDQDKTAADLESAKKSLESASKHGDDAFSTSNGTRAMDDIARSVSIPSTAFNDVDELAEVKTPKRKEKRQSGKWSPSVGSPLRSEVQYGDYIGAPIEPRIEPNESSDQAIAHAISDAAKGRPERIHDSGYYAPDDQESNEIVDRDSAEEFFSAGSDDRKKSKGKARESERYDDRDSRSVISSGSKYDDEPEREERHRRRRERESERSPSQDRGYEYDDGERRKRHHRRRETDEKSDDWDSRSIVSEARSEPNGERRRKHRRRDSERNGSPEDRTRSSAASDPGDLYERERKSSRRKSKRDDDDSVSIVSSPGRYDEERSSKKDKEKRSSGLFGIFSKSKESLVDTSSKSSRSKYDDDDDEDRRHRKKKHRDRGSTYGSDDDDARSTVSSSSRREKHRSRTDSRDDRYADEDQSFLGDRAVAATPLPGSETPSHENKETSPQTHLDSGIPGDRPEFPLPTLDDSHPFPLESRDVERPKTPVEDSRTLLTRLTGLAPWQLEAFPDELPPLPVSRPSSPHLESPEQKRSPYLTERRHSSTSVPLRFRRPPASPSVQRDLTLDLKQLSSPASSPLQPPRPRHTKTPSTEFIKGTREYRPLYLVERNRKSTELDEVLPALPSSGSPSRASSERETEDEYQSALESPHLSASDALDNSFMDQFGFASPPNLDLQDREIEELPESQQTTPKASTFPAGVLEPRQDAAPRAHDIEANKPEIPNGLGLSIDEPIESRSAISQPQSPLAPSAPIDDSKMRNTAASRSRDPSPTKSSSALQDAALGALIGGAAATALRHRSPSPAGYDSDFMGGAPDQETIDLAAQSIPPVEQEPERPVLTRAPSSSSKKGKKKKGSKSKSIDFDAESPKELTAEDLQAIRLKDTEDAMAGLLDDPVEEPKPVEEKKSEPITVPSEPDPNLLRRDSKGKGKGKKKVKAKKGSISTPTESPAPTPTDEQPDPLPSSSHIPQFVENEEDWAKNRAESVITDDATLVGEPSASQYGSSPEVTSKEFRRQKLLDATTPSGQDDSEVRNVAIDSKAPQLHSKTSLQDLLGPALSRKLSETKLKDVEQPVEGHDKPVDLWAATTPKMGTFTRSPTDNNEAMKPVSEERQAQVEQEILRPSFPDAGEVSKYLVTTPSSEENQPVTSNDVPEAKPPVNVMDFLVQESDTTPPARDDGKKDILPTPETSADLTTQQPELSRDLQATATSEPASSWGSSLLGAFGWGRKRSQPSTPEPKSPAVTPAPVEEPTTLPQPIDLSSSEPPAVTSVDAGVKYQDTQQPDLEFKEVERDIPATSTAEDEWAPPVSKKKAKKDKKEKRASIQASEPVQTAAEEESTSLPRDSTELAEQTRESLQPDLTTADTVSEPPNLAREDEWAFPVTKKKEKKGKKGKKAQRESEQPATPTETEPSTPATEALEVSETQDSTQTARDLASDENILSGAHSEPALTEDQSFDHGSASTEQIAEDEWAAPVSKKDKKKKAKKARASQVFSDDLPSTTEPDASATVDERSFRPSDFVEPEASTQPEIPAVEPQKEEEPSELAQEQIEEVDWAAPVSKKDKKKGKKKKAAFEALTPEPISTPADERQASPLDEQSLPESSALPLSQDLSETTVSAPEAQTLQDPESIPGAHETVDEQARQLSDIVIPAQGPDHTLGGQPISTPAEDVSALDQEEKQEDAEDWAPLSKKDKKKAAKKAKKASLLESEEPTPVSTPSEEQRAVTFDEPSISLPQASDQRRDEQDDATDSWTPMSKKDKKKAKKTKKGSIVESEWPEAMSASISDAQEVPLGAQSDPQTPVTEELDSQAQDDGIDDWAPTSKNDKKKAKKAKKAAFAVDEPSVTSVLQSEGPESEQAEPSEFSQTRSAETISQETESSVPAAELQPAPVSLESVQPGQLVEPEAHDAPFIPIIETDKPLEIQQSETPVEAQEATVDDWGFTPSKKDKKGKKAKKRQSIVEEPTVTVSESIPEPQTLTTTETPLESSLEAITEPSLEKALENTSSIQPESQATQVIEDPAEHAIEQPLAVSSEVQEQEAGEDWGFPTSKKKKGKGKKGKRESVVEEPARDSSVPEVEPGIIPYDLPSTHLPPIESGEPLTHEPETIASEDVPPTSHIVADPSEPQSQVESREQDHHLFDATEHISTVPSTEERAIEPAEEDWGFPISKKDKKKGKKAKGKQSGTATPTQEAVFEVQPADTTEPALPVETQLSTEDIEPLATPVEPVEPAEEDWGVPMSKKDKKKAKKAKGKQSGTATPTFEATLESPIDAIETKEPTEKRELEDEPPISTPSAEQEEPMADEWALPPTKKKGKKKGKKSAFESPSNETADPIAETGISSELAPRELETTTVGQEPETTSESVEPVPASFVASAEPAEPAREVIESEKPSLSRKLSKKEKKAKKNAAALAWDDETTAQTADAGDLDVVREVQPAQPAEPTQPIEPEISSVVEQDMSRTSEGERAGLEPGTSQHESFEQVHEESHATIQEPSAELGVPSDVLEIRADIAGQEELPMPSNEQPEEVSMEDEWTSFEAPKKKGKKGKRQSAAFDLTDEADSKPSEQPKDVLQDPQVSDPSGISEAKEEVDDLRTVPQPHDTTVETATEKPVLGSSQPEVETALSQSFDGGIPREDPTAEPQAVQETPQDGEADDFWAPISRKASKKGKKGKKAKEEVPQPSNVFEEPSSSAIVQPEPLAETTTSQPFSEAREEPGTANDVQKEEPEDDWGFPTKKSKKDKKKGKKSKQTSGTATPIVEKEPEIFDQPTAIRDDVPLADISDEPEVKPARGLPTFDDAPGDHQLAPIQEPKPVSFDAEPSVLPAVEDRPETQPSDVEKLAEALPEANLRDASIVPGQLEDSEPKVTDNDTADFLLSRSSSKKKSKKDKKAKKGRKDIDDEAESETPELARPETETLPTVQQEAQMQEKQSPMSPTFEDAQESRHPELQSIPQTVDIDQEPIIAPSIDQQEISTASAREVDIPKDAHEQPLEPIEPPVGPEVANQQDIIKSAELSPSLQALHDDIAELKQRSEALDDALSPANDRELDVPEASTSQPTSMFDVVGKLSKKDKKKGKKAKGSAFDWSEPTTPATETEPELPVESKETQVEETPFEAPSRKMSKKDKKKAKAAALAWDEPEETVTPAEVVEKAIEDQPTTTDANVEFPEQPSQAPVQEPELTPTDLPTRKLSKKDKKKAKAAAMVWEEPSETSTPVSEPQELISEEPTGLDTPPIAAESRELPQEDTSGFSAPTRKLSKKEKKKAAKAAAFDWTEPEVSESQPELLSETRDVVQEDAGFNPEDSVGPVGDEPTPMSIEKSQTAAGEPIISESHEGVRESIVPEPHEVAQEPVIPEPQDVVHEPIIPESQEVIHEPITSEEQKLVTEEPPVLSRKLSKKDKKKAKAAALAWDEPVSDPRDIEPTVSEFQTPIGEESIASEPQPPAVVEAPVLSCKLSKKDKKKAKAAAFAWDEPTTETTESTALDESQQTAADEVEQAPAIEQQEATDDRPTSSRKLSKKEKKKAKQASLWDEPTEPSPSATPPTVEKDSVAEVETSTALPTSQDVILDTSEPDDLSTPPTLPTSQSQELPEEDFTGFAPTRKLSKKDKKKAKAVASAWDEPETSNDLALTLETDPTWKESEPIVTEATETVQEPQHTSIESDNLVHKEEPSFADARESQLESERIITDVPEVPHFTEPSSVEMEETRQTDTSAPQFNADEVTAAPALTRKQSKKDKKKNGKASTFDWSEPSTSMEEPVSVPEPQPPIEEQMAVDDFAPQLSKKDKKKSKKKAAFGWDTPDPEASQATLAKETTRDVNVTQPEIEVPESQPSLVEKTLVAPIIVSDHIPTDTQNDNAPDQMTPLETQPTIVEVAKNDEHALMEDIQTSQPEPEPEFEFSSKKSKKQKRKSKTASASFEDPVEDVAMSTSGETVQDITTEATPAQLEPEPEQEWGFSSKKSKKEKRKSKAAESFNEPVQDVEMSTLQEEVLEPALSETPAIEQPVSTPVEEPEFELTTKKSKKEKRKSKKAGAIEEPIELSEAQTIQENVVQPSLEQPPETAIGTETRDIQEPGLGQMSEAGTKPIEVPQPEVEAIRPVTAKAGKKKKHKLAAFFEPDTPEKSVQPSRAETPKPPPTTVVPEEPISQPPPETHGLDRDIKHEPAVDVAREQSISESRAKSPEQDIDFAARVGIGLQESGFDPSLVLNDPSFHRSTSPQGPRDISPEDDVAAARDGASRSKFGTMGRTSPSPTSPKSQSTNLERDLTHTETPAASFDPVDVLNDPVFSQRKTPPGVLEEADPEELWSSSKKTKKGKSKKKRESAPDTPVESEDRALESMNTLPVGLEDEANTDERKATLDMNPIDSWPTSESIQPIQTMQEAPTDEQPELFWEDSSSKKKGKKAKKDKKRASLAQDTVESSAVEAPVIEAPTAVPLTVETPADSMTRETHALQAEYEKPSLSSTLEPESRNVPQERLASVDLQHDQPQFVSTEPAPTAADDLWDEPSKKKGKKGKGKLKRSSTAEQIVESETPLGTITSQVEDITPQQSFDTTRDFDAVQDNEVDDWTSSKKKSKKSKKGKAGTEGLLAAGAAVGAAALGAMALDRKKDDTTREFEKHRSADVEATPDLPPTFDEEPKSLGGVEAGEYPFPKVSTPAEDKTVSAHDLETTRATERDSIDEWALPSKKKGKKGKKGKAELVEVQAEKLGFNEPKIQQAEKPITREKALEGLGIEEPTVYDQKRDVVQDPGIHVSHAAIHEPHVDIHNTSHKDESTTRGLGDTVGEKTSPSSKLSGLFPGVERVKRRAPPVSTPEAQPEEKRVHLSGPMPEMSTIHHEPEHMPPAIVEPTWSFGGVRDSAVHVADSPLVSTAPQFQANMRDSGYHDAGYSPSIPQGSSEPVEGFIGKEKQRSQEPKSPHGISDRAIEQHQEVQTRSRSPSLPEPSSFAPITSPSAIDSATKERTSYLFNSSPSTRGYGDSPSISTKPHSHDNAPIAFGLKDSHSGSHREHHDPSIHSVASPRSKEPSSPTRHVKEPYQSIFGDPSQKKSEKSATLTTPSSKHIRTPSAQLDTIKEFSSPDDSPLHKKGRAISDVGVPERGVKAPRRSTSPKPTSKRSKSPPPQTPTPSSRKHVAPPLDTSVRDTPAKDSPWNQVHESVDRSMTLSPARRFPHDQRSPPTTDPSKQRFGEQRSPSVLSDRSTGGITRHRTPDHLRPLSSASNRSATPPLRRVDRSASGDLRSASKLGEDRARGAKNAQPDLSDFALAAGATAAIVAGIASSSKYDPVKDKGKGRADMPDVYVSFRDSVTMF